MMDCRPERNGKVTILDVMGVDLCRDAILDNVHIRDIVRSERVCRRWQRAVLGYLPRCRNLTLSIYQRSRVLKHNHRAVIIRDDGTFPVRNVLEKLGPLIVSLYTNRCDKAFYKHIAAYCLRLRHLTLKHLRYGDEILGRAFQNIQLEKVKLVKCTVTGQFLHLMNLNSLESLSMVNCAGLRRRWLALTVYCFHKLINLEIKNYENLSYVVILLRTMPKLQKVFLKGYIDFEYEDSFVQACSRLDNLKCIDFREDNIYEGIMEHVLEEFARSCKKLEFLNIASTINCPHGRGLAALILRPSPGTLLCFTRVREEHKDILLEYLQPLNNELQRNRRKEITLEMLNEAFQSTEKCDMLELRLVYPAAQNAKLYPELKIILNVSFVRIPDEAEVELDLAEAEQDLVGVEPNRADVDPHFGEGV